MLMLLKQCALNSHILLPSYMLRIYGGIASERVSLKTKKIVLQAFEIYLSYRGIDNQIN